MSKTHRNPTGMLVVGVMATLGSMPLQAADAVKPPGCAVARRTFTHGAADPIPSDSGLVTSHLRVAGLGGRVFTVKVLTALLHPSPGELDLTLTSPQGTVVTLSTDNGGTLPDAFAATEWRDDANPGGLPPYDTNAGLASDDPFVSPPALLAPEESLGAFSGEDPTGEWTLTVAHDVAGSAGTLQQWALEIQTIPEAFVASLSPHVNATAAPIGAGAPSLVSSSIVVPFAPRPRFLNRVLVRTDITHAAPSDLDIVLRSASGTYVTLTSDNGRPNAATLAGTEWRDDANLGGALPYVTNFGLASDHPYPDSGTVVQLAPEEPLAALLGEEITGTWTLYVSDDSTGNGGTLNSWSLEFETLSECASKGDFDHSATDDLVLRKADNQHMLWLMNGTTLGSSAPIAPQPEAAKQVVASDLFLGDTGFADLVLRDSSTGQVEFWAMSGADRVGDPVLLGGAAPLPLNWKLSATGDFNHDGRADLVWRNLTSQKLVIWTLGEGSAPATTKTGVIVPSPDQAVHANWELVAALDFDGDNNRDFLWYNATSGKIVAWFMNAAVQRTLGSFTSPPSAGDANWRVVAAGDFGLGSAVQGDGVPDIVWRNATSGKLVVWLMDGGTSPPQRLQGVFTSPDSPSEPLAWTVVAPK